MDVDPSVYRRVVGRFATGIAVVTTVHENVDHAMTVNSFTSVSLHPLLVLFCANRVGRFHDVVLRSRFFGVSILGAGGEGDSRAFAVRGRSPENQLDGRAFHRGPHTGAALLDSALATLECRIRTVHDAGDHSIVVGEVADVILRDPAEPPLLYFAGDYHTGYAPEAATSG
ncbi:flavin reductase family protein [Rhizohabitans arisaemae]|uniref:flavin reductase family protein n=1 Tax=Rhizohabitans arisaemae TaxID=2720610 RepID=UPI0024B215B2|nr:flavin reductase family protein [Rhizohabitans arisaemae]